MLAKLWSLEQLGCSFYGCVTFVFSYVFFGKIIMWRAVFTYTKKFRYCKLLIVVTLTFNNSGAFKNIFKRAKKCIR